jgi:hypothetical protein
MAGKTASEKHADERDKFQKDLDSNRQWHRPQEHKFEVAGVTGESAAGTLFLTVGKETLDLCSSEVQTLIQELGAAFQAVS